MNKFICLLVFLTIGLTLQAQEADAPVLPSGPLLRRTPEFSTWSVVIQGASAASGGALQVAANSGSGQPKPTVVAQSTVVKTGGTIFERNVDAKGRKSEIWHIGGLRVISPPGSTIPIVTPDFGGGDIYSVNFRVSDFAGLDWISEKTFTGIEKYNERECIVFRDKISPLPSDSRREEIIAIAQARANEARAGKKGASNEVEVPTESLVPTAAYIDLESRLPLLVLIGKETRLYQYGIPPNSALVLDPVAAKALGDYQKRLKRLSR